MSDQAELYRSAAIGAKSWRSPIDPNQLTIDEVALSLSVAADRSELALCLAFECIVSGFSPKRLCVAGLSPASIGTRVPQLVAADGTCYIVYDVRGYQDSNIQRSDEAEANDDDESDLSSDEDVEDDSESLPWKSAGLGLIRRASPWLRPLAERLAAGGSIGDVASVWARLCRLRAMDVDPTPTLRRMAGSSEFLMSDRRRVDHAVIRGALRRDVEPDRRYLHQSVQKLQQGFDSDVQKFRERVAGSSATGNALRRWMERYSS